MDPSLSFSVSESKSFVAYLETLIQGFRNFVVITKSWFSLTKKSTMPASMCAQKKSTQLEAAFVCNSNKKRYFCSVQPIRGEQNIVCPVGVIFVDFPHTVMRSYRKMPKCDVIQLWRAGHHSDDRYRFCLFLPSVPCIIWEYT